MLKPSAKLPGVPLVVRSKSTCWRELEPVADNTKDPYWLPRFGCNERTPFATLAFTAKVAVGRPPINPVQVVVPGKLQL